MKCFTSFAPLPATAELPVRREAGATLRKMAFAPLVVLILQAAAQADLKVDITYSNGQILSGPVSADLDALPGFVQASFTLNGTPSGDYSSFGLADVSQSSLVFGDGVWSASDLESFSTTIMPGDVGFFVASLTYAYRPIDTPTVDGRLAANFPLDIRGTDRATGQAFEYRYDTSSSTVTIIPEPATVVLSIVALALSAVRRRRTRRKTEE